MAGGNLIDKRLVSIFLFILAILFQPLSIWGQGDTMLEINIEDREALSGEYSAVISIYMKNCSDTMQGFCYGSGSTEPTLWSSRKFSTIAVR
ncbi:MAG: hypothetical protein ACE5K8_05195 [Candidatus Zixiibacteriota bacterium]